MGAHRGGKLGVFGLHALEDRLHALRRRREVLLVARVAEVVLFVPVPVGGGHRGEVRHLSAIVHNFSQLLKRET